MAANVVRVQLSEAQRGVREFNHKLSELTRQINILRNRTNETTTWWEGDTGTAYRESFGRACDHFEQTLTRKLQEHSQSMLKSVELQHAQDTNVASRIVRH